MPVTIENTGYQINTVSENKTLDTSEFFPKQAMNQIVSSPPETKTNGVDEQYDIKHVIDPISPTMPIKMRHKFVELAQKFPEVFFSKIQ